MAKRGFHYGFVMFSINGTDETEGFNYNNGLVWSQY
jgi:hypothetical protein